MKIKLFLLIVVTVLAVQGCGVPENAAAQTESNAQPQPKTPPNIAQTRAPAQDPVLPLLKPVIAEASSPEHGIGTELLRHLLVAEIAGQRGRIDVALDNYLAATRLSLNAEIAERTTRVAVYSRDNKKALEAAQIWVAQDPDNLDAHQVVAALLIRTGQTDLALSHLERVVNGGGLGEQRGFMLVTSLLSKEEDKQAALAVMEKLISRRKDNAYALYAYAHLAYLVGDYKKAEDALKQCKVIRPDWMDATLLQANILSRKGQEEAALKLLRTELTSHADDINLRLFYARKLVDLKMLDEAYEQFTILLKQSPEHSDARYAGGLLAYRLGKLDEAKRHFMHLVKSKMRSDDAHFYLGQIAEREEGSATALEQYALVRGGDYEVDAKIRTAVLMARNGQFDEAHEQLREIDTDNTDVQLRVYIAEGEILDQAKDYEGAFEHYTDALGQMPDNNDLLYARALTAEKLNRTSIAVQDLRDIIARDPNNVTALNALGYTLVDKTTKLDEGLALIKRAYKQNPNDAAIIDSLGWAYYRKGDYKQALQHLQHAFGIYKDAEIAAHLGEVLWVSGDKRGARSIWDQALRSTPTHQTLLDVIKRFTK